MIASLDEFELGSVLDVLQAVTAAAVQVELCLASPAELTATLRELELVSRRLETAKRRLVAQIDQRQLGGGYGANKTATLLSQLLLINPAEARARVSHAQDYSPRVALTGEILAPIFPDVAAALDTGEISLAHADIITKTITALPEHVEFEYGCEAQRFLVEQAHHLNPSQLGHAATRLRDTLDPDGEETRDKDQQRRREFTLIVHADGSSTPKGHLTPELTTVFRPVLDSLAKPAPAADGTPDPRTPGQRRHDARLDAALRLLRSDTLPDSGGTPVTVLLSITAPATPDGVATVTDGYDTPVPVATAIRLSDQAEVNTAVLTATGTVLSMGRSRRIATAAQRRALTIRDKGCSHPGCTIPAAWTEAHHIIPWRDGGETNIDNLVLVCGHDHRTFQANGWTIRMSPDHIPEWIPPAWRDPEQKPRRNTARDIPTMP